MRRLAFVFLFATQLFRTDLRAANFNMPVFPMPKLAEDEFGQTKRIGLLSFIRLLYSGGVSSQSADDVNLLDSDYAVIDSGSLPVLAAWLEATCRGIDFDLKEARQGPYDGTVAARLLEVGASLAAVRGNSGLAMPIGFLICIRRKPWGSVPGDGGRDAYALIATERGLEVYDPPTRQLVGLSDFPNTADILNIQF